MKFLNNILQPFVKLFRQPIESFIRLETSADEHTIVAEDGSIVTYLRIDGSRQLIGEQEYWHIIETLTLKMGTRFDRPGHAVQFYFTRNYDRIKDEIQKLIRPNHTAAKNIGLELEDLFEERGKNLCRFLAWEEIYMVLWTRPSALTKSDIGREQKIGREIKWVNAKDSQYPFKAMGALKTKHRAFVTGVKG